MTNTPTILNGPISRNPLDLNQRVWRPENWSTSNYPSTRKLSIQVPAVHKTDMCENSIMHEVQFSTNDQWHVG
jgi:hypothetical protein